VSARWQDDMRRHLRAQTRAVALVDSLRSDMIDQSSYESLLSEVRGSDARALVRVLANLLFEALEELPNSTDEWWAAADWWLSVEKRTAGMADVLDRL
jgi:hypothetical protein